ncbi:RF-1 domain-containing protein [Panaeolus papilionaceus]|nr:RF-1 domain-containing protein [Panaeolus papilionaceus]
MNFTTYVFSRNVISRAALQPLIRTHLGRSFYTSPRLDDPIRPPSVSELRTEQEHKEAESWVHDFKAQFSRIPRSLVDLSFSRSSGPGGQNVNKVNTKATLRCSIDSPWIPRWSLPHLKNTPHYAPSSHSLLITSSVHRSQAQNIDECLEKLRDLIIVAASAPIQKATSPEQKKKVEELVKADKERRKREKMHKSDVKRGRRNQDLDF